MRLPIEDHCGAPAFPLNRDSPCLDEPKGKSFLLWPPWTGISSSEARGPSACAFLTPEEDPSARLIPLIISQPNCRGQTSGPAWTGRLQTEEDGQGNEWMGLFSMKLISWDQSCRLVAFQWRRPRRVYFCQEGYETLHASQFLERQSSPTTEFRPRLTDDVN